MKNYLLDAINQFYKELASIEGRIYVLNWYMNRYQDEVKKLQKSNLNLSESILTSRDLSQTNNAFNWFNTDYGYALKYSDINDEVEYILSREYCFSLAHIYEMTESFLNQIISDFLFHNQQYLLSLGLLKAKIHLTKGTVKEIVMDKLARKKNNRKLISAIKQISGFYKQHESDNIHKINLTAWFDLLSEVRHIITHNRKVVSNNLLKYISNKEKSKLFEYYFERRKTYDGTVIFLSNNKFALNAQLVNQYAYLIFKSLSLECNLNPTYFKLN